MNETTDEELDLAIPAFPQSTWPGMSLRDYFASQALSGVLRARVIWGAETTQGIAEECYELADAMLTARTRERKQ